MANAEKNINVSTSEIEKIFTKYENAVSHHTEKAGEHEDTIVGNIKKTSVAWLVIYKYAE